MMSAVISSRTPEGILGDCPNCGAAICVEPSWPAGDAPCPDCGSLVWFDTNEWFRAVEPIGESVPFVADRAADREDIQTPFKRIQETLVGIRAVSLHAWNIELIKEVIASVHQVLAAIEPSEEGVFRRAVRARVVAMIEEIKALIVREQAVRAHESSRRAAVRPSRRSSRSSPFAANVSRLANWVASAPAGSSRRLVIRQRL